jgi:AcrR family transcriptional regulator
VNAEQVARPSTRRHRARLATAQEIKSAARRLLVERGPDGLTLRSIARQVGMTAPAIYRYFPSREDLLEHVVADLYGEVTTVLEAARDGAPADDPAGPILAVSRAFRRWALEHPAEFGLLFGSPIPGLADPADGDHRGAPAHTASRRFGRLFGELVAGLYQRRPFPIRADAEIDPRLAGQLQEWCEDFQVPLPLGGLQVFLSCWIRLYGAVCLETFGHLRFAVEDAEAVFEAELRSLAGMLGTAELYRPPAAQLIGSSA